MDKEAIEDFDYFFKIVLIGDSNVGKSCIAVRYSKGSYEETLSTIGAEFYWKTLYRQDKKIKLQLWDTAGQERFRSITKSYFRNAHAICLVFDVTKQDSFDKLISYWLHDMLLKHEPDALEKMIICVVGNKTDLEDERQVNREEVEKVLKENKIKNYFETSAKEDTYITECFETLIDEILSKMRGNDIVPTTRETFNIADSETIYPKHSGKQKKSKNCCA